MGDTLKVPGARLYHEVSGTGPVLLFIGGGTSDTSNYDGVGPHFADRYTVVSYDRRGNSRSTLDGPAGPQRIEEHADDAIRLIEHLGTGPADVFGSSSGALIALDVAARRPDLVRRVVPHEAPAFTLTPDEDAHLAILHRAAAEFERAGAAAGMAVFGNGTGVPDEFADAGPEALEALRRIEGNAPFFFRHEMLQFVAYRPDLPALGRHRDLLVPAVGEESVDTPPVQAMRVLAKEIGTEVTAFPGGHVGYLQRPVEFAARLAEVLT
ncbi:alpha/beta hydrolase [Saccharothrix violaceirubra]|uniref:Pimeloyl-ACP methyl ester carboxylesterase n=1 Tax=Saccharothrix violaceirubra TaxID=413306 RepID=A0A7W7WXR1_9PSEU|nr:alpha/beta hydrolase [Saccharothrix violaceirubra]MBB4967336.1 pimeloyl-ACP methyl ester carboxylesterase [Saccharothrix violaceirubra]